MLALDASTLEVRAGIRPFADVRRVGLPTLRDDIVEVGAAQEDGQVLGQSASAALVEVGTFNVGSRVLSHASVTRRSTVGVFTTGRFLKVSHASITRHHIANFKIVAGMIRTLFPWCEP